MSGTTFDDELHGKRAPDYLQDFVARIGGLTPFGVPRYRVVWAPSVRHKAYGVFSDWEDELEPSQRGGLVQNDDGSFQQTSIKPKRVVEEMRWLETYPFDEGWIIERWYPANMFGDPENWNATPLLGPYPTRGRYVDCCNPIRNLPTFSQVEGLIQAIEYKIANKEGTMQQRVMKRYEKILRATEERKRQARELNKAKLYDGSRFLLGDSLAAGRYREMLAQRIRARGGQISHVGN